MGLVTGTLKNNGYSPEIEPADSYGASLTGGPLRDNTFELLQFHVHFGCTNDRGSEHKLDGTQLSGQVNVSAMWAFFLLHLTYRHFRFLISWPAGYLCLGKRSQWSIKDHPGRECIYVFDIQCWAILLAIEKYFHRSWHEWFHRQVCLPIGVRRICICFKFRSASHCDLLLVIGKVIGLIDNRWVHAGAMLSWVISYGGQQKRTMQKLKKTNQKLMLDLKHLSL